MASAQSQSDVGVIGDVGERGDEGVSLRRGEDDHRARASRGRSGDGLQVREVWLSVVRSLRPGGEHF